MSHTAEYYTPVIKVPVIDMRTDQANIERHPNFDLLKRAIEIVLSERGGEFAKSIRNNEGKDTPCVLAIKTKDFPRGVGIKIDQKGEVSFHYDAFGGYEKLAKEIEDEITRKYKVVVHIWALKNIGYNVEVDERDGDILVEGVV